ncbi:MAG: hypothetical protein DGJ47_001005 [Rickettsiaceae bacterium]
MAEEEQTIRDQFTSTLTGRGSEPEPSKETENTEPTQTNSEPEPSKTTAESEFTKETEEEPTNQELAARIDALKEELAKLQAEWETQSNQDLAGQIKAIEEKIAQYQEEVNNSSAAEVKNLQDQINTLSTEAQGYRDQLNAQMTETTEAVKTMSAQIDALKAELTKLQAEGVNQVNEEVVAQVKAIEEKLAQYQEEVKNSSAAEVQNLEDQIKALSTEAQGYRDQLNAQMTETTEAVKTMSAQIDALKAELTKLQAEGVNQVNEEVVAQVKAIEEKLAQWEGQNNEELVEKIKEIETYINSEETQGIWAQIHFLKGSISQITQSLFDQENIDKEIITKLDELTESLDKIDIEAIQTRISQHEEFTKEGISQLSENSESLIAKTEASEAALKEAQNQLQESQTKLLNVVNDLNAKVESGDSELKNYQEKLSSLESILVESQEKFSQANDDLSKKVLEYKELMQNALAEFDKKILSTIEELKEINANLNIQIDLNTNANTEMKNDLLTFEKESEEKVNTIQESVAKLDDRLSSYENIAKDEFTKLNQKDLDLNAQIDLNTNANDEIKNDLLAFEKESEEKVNTIQESVAKLDDRLSSYEDISKNEFTRLAKESENLSSEVKESFAEQQEAQDGIAVRLEKYEESTFVKLEQLSKEDGLIYQAVSDLQEEIKGFKENASDNQDNVNSSVQNHLEMLENLSIFLTEKLVVARVESINNKAKTEALICTLVDEGILQEDKANSILNEGGRTKKAFSEKFKAAREFVKYFDHIKLQYNISFESELIDKAFQYFISNVNKDDVEKVMQSKLLDINNDSSESIEVLLSMAPSVAGDNVDSDFA